MTATGKYYNISAIEPNGKDTWKGTSLSPGHLNLELAKCQSALLGAQSYVERF